jgi:quercetin dioxygenase-like cupin family protein
MNENLFKFVAPNEALSVTAVGMIHNLLVMGKENDNAYSVTEIVVSPQAGPPLHRHAGLEAFYVLDGTFQFQVGDEKITGEAGSFVTIPPMVFHVWHNAGSELARVLCIIVPGGMEQMFVESGHAVTDRSAPPLSATPEDIRLTTIAAEKYGVEVKLS